MNPQSPRPNPTHTARPGALQAGDALLDAAVTRALSMHPPVRIPGNFAARAAAHAAAQPTARRTRWIGWGPRLALGSGALLTAALFALAPGAVPSLTSPRFDAELLIFAELSTLLLFVPRLLHRD